MSPQDARNNLPNKKNGGFRLTAQGREVAGTWKGGLSENPRSATVTAAIRDVLMQPGRYWTLDVTTVMVGRQGDADPPPVPLSEEGKTSNGEPALHRLALTRGLGRVSSKGAAASRRQPAVWMAEV